MKIVRETADVINDPLTILNTQRWVFYTAVIVCLVLALKPLRNMTGMLSPSSRPASSFREPARTIPSCAHHSR
jgi:hypothetical protein